MPSWSSVFVKKKVTAAFTRARADFIVHFLLSESRENDLPLPIQKGPVFPFTLFAPPKAKQGQGAYAFASFHKPTFYHRWECYIGGPVSTQEQGAEN